MDANLSRYCAGDEYVTAAADRRRGKMTPHKISLCRISTAVMMLVLAAACIPLPGTVPRSAPQVVEPLDDQAIAHPLNRETGIIIADDPRTLVKQAKGAADERAVPLLLRAIAGFIRQSQFGAAQTLITRLQYLPMAGFQRHELLLHQAHLTQALGQHERALELLRALEQSPALSAQASTRLLLLRADSQRALGRNDEVATRLQLDTLLEPAGRVANQRRILDLIESLDPLGRLLLRENPDDDAIHGWVALSETLQSEAPEERTTAIGQWRALYPGHPAAPRLFNQRLLADESTRYRHIAMLLPLTSKFGQAARAFYEGFMAARHNDPARRQPAVSLYDIGEDPYLVSLYYQAAINDGADFMVGPLGRRTVNALLSGPRLQLPMLMIGTVPADKTAPNLYGISLSPEQEARQVAVRAFADGHRQAGIFKSETGWGQRVANAFAAQWELLGGTVVDNTPFADDISGYPRVIRKLLGLDKSIIRERMLSARLGINMEFTPRRRDDIDFLFLAANADQARLLVPQLRFFQAHDLALYATSYVYSGNPEPAIDADLDGIIFGDMNWILDAAMLPESEPESEPEPEPEPEPELKPGSEPGPQPLPTPEPGTASSPEPQTGTAAAPEPPASSQPDAPEPPPPAREPGPYYHTDLDRLYALGLEGYQVIPGLRALRRDPKRRYFGKAVDLGVEADGNVFRHLTWARFVRGLAVPLPGTTVDTPAPRAPGQ